MKNFLTFIFIFFIGISLIRAQVIFSEDFESGQLPDGWLIQSNASDGGWVVGTPSGLSSQYFTFLSNGSNYIIGTNDDDCNCDKSNEYLITPLLDFTDHSALILKFDAYYEDNAFQNSQEEATIEISLDSVNWTVLEDLHGHGSWDKHIIDLSPYAGEDTVYIGFRYHDDSGWMYGFGIDNVSIEVPASLDAELVEVNSKKFGEVGNVLPLTGTIYNNGASTINSLHITYNTDGFNPVSESINNINVPAFSYYEFELTNPWLAVAAGDFVLEMTIDSVNGSTDEILTNNTGSFNTQIFDVVEVPNKIDSLLNTIPLITEVANAGDGLNKPTDLDFFPILGKDELWIINQRIESSGGSTVTISDATNGPSDFWMRVDGNAWHFMSLPTGIAFSSDNFNFASSPGVKDANHNNGTFTGPTLWSSDPEIYAQPSGGNGSHLDMLHGSPFSMGIAHEIDNVFWVYDDWNKDIVRYDFVEDHGPGNDDHSDAIVRRFKNIGINADADIPNHLILDKNTDWLYFVDNGNDRVIRLDINSDSVRTSIPTINEPLAEHSRVNNFTYEVIIDTDLVQACGIEIFENYLFVGDYSNGDIVVYDMINNFVELGRIVTNEPGLTGIKIGPDGNLWCTNRIQNTLIKVQPSQVTSTTSIVDNLSIDILPNPSTGNIRVSFSNEITNMKKNLLVKNTSGQNLIALENVRDDQELDLSDLPNGIYFLTCSAETFFITKRIVIQK